MIVDEANLFRENITSPPPPLPIASSKGLPPLGAPPKEDLDSSWADSVLGGFQPGSVFTVEVEESRPDNNNNSNNAQIAKELAEREAAYETRRRLRYFVTKYVLGLVLSVAWLALIVATLWIALVRMPMCPVEPRLPQALLGEKCRSFCHMLKVIVQLQLVRYCTHSTVLFSQKIILAN